MNYRSCEASEVPNVAERSEGSEATAKRDQTSFRILGVPRVVLKNVSSSRISLTIVLDYSFSSKVVLDYTFFSSPSLD